MTPEQMQRQKNLNQTTPSEIRAVGPDRVLTYPPQLPVPSEKVYIDRGNGLEPMMVTEDGRWVSCMDWWEY